MIEAAFAEFASVALRKPVSKVDRATPSRQQFLLCGMHAVNAVLEVIQRPRLEKAQMDTINDNMALEEALLLENGSAQETAVQAAGNYSVEVVAAALRCYGDCSVDRVAQLPVPPGFYVVGNGNHWQMAASLPNGQRVLSNDGVKFPVVNPTSFFRNKLERGAVLRISHPSLGGAQPVAASSPFLINFSTDGVPLAIETPPQPPAQLTK